MTSRLAVLFGAMAGLVLLSIFVMTVMRQESFGGNFTNLGSSNQQLQHNMQPAASFGYEANIAMGRPRILWRTCAPCSSLAWRG